MQEQKDNIDRLPAFESDIEAIYDTTNQYINTIYQIEDKETGKVYHFDNLIGQLNYIKKLGGIGMRYKLISIERHKRRNGTQRLISIRHRDYIRKGMIDCVEEEKIE